ncbi:MAG: NAD-dependent epimerase/dehydratase family protein [SAR324 cluster bacterium]|uniref:NAD-dependent epimerase/dehydratase family protein n=1 Tax=SAR324 cluster bacterium TaxID=2024889 RepID=A0A7X9ILC5_9DELT|nr:NAD-dependent epimerase/dehydratase family protein [SAR324 cluster bacterium]
MNRSSKQLFLVTGANGFVGSNLVEYLYTQNVNVRAMLRDPKKATKLKHLDIEVMIGDLMDKESLQRCCEGVYGIYHIAALFNQAGLPESKFFEVNVQGTKRLLDAAIEAGVKRFVHCSTNGVHGDIKGPPADESAPYSPCDEYQRSKVEGEKLVLEYFSNNKINGVVIRPAMIYGPGDTRLFKIFRMIQKKRFFYVGKGDAWCHFIDVRDLVRSFHLAMQNENIKNGVFLIAGERQIRLNEVVDFIADELKVKRPWLHIPLKPMQALGTLCELLCAPFGIQPPLYKRRVDFFIKNRSFNTTRARQELGFVPQRKLEEELRDIINWYQEKGWLARSPGTH